MAADCWLCTRLTGLAGVQTFAAGLVINSLSFVPTDGCWVHGFRNDPDALYRLAQARAYHAECSAEL